MDDNNHADAVQMTIAFPKPVKAVKKRKGMTRQNMRRKPLAAKSGAYKLRSKQIHRTPCMVCYKYGLEQLSPTAEHHWIMGRFKGTKTPDEEMMPVCEGHHQGLRDTSKIAIHKEPKLWMWEYGRDKDWLGYANDLIAEYN